MATSQSEQVILLHGLARTKYSLRQLEKSLTKHGYRVFNIGYASTRLSVEAAAAQVFEQAKRLLDPTLPVHIVTHSLGGILVRHYLSQHHLPQLKRIVMLAPPNAGSEIVDHLSHWRLFRWFNGPAGLQLGTLPSSLPCQLPGIEVECGIIAGSRSYSCWLGRYLPARHDGKVSVASTQLTGMTDHLVVNASHTFIMNHPQTLAAVSHFFALRPVCRAEDNVITGILAFSINEDFHHG